MEKISRERFIRLGSALGVGAAAASLVACGGGSSGSSGDSSGGSSGGGGSEESKQPKSSQAGEEAQESAAIAKESEVAPGSAVEFKDGGEDAVLVHLESGDFVAYSAICTHQGCTVAYDDGQLACPCHGSVYDPAKGAEVVAGPAPSPLEEIPVKVEGGQVLRA